MNYPPRPEHLHERGNFSLDHAANAATTTLKLGTKVTKPFVVTKVWYVNHTGLAQSGVNSFAVSVRNGATVIATGVDTATVALVGGTTVVMTLSTVAGACRLAVGDELSAVFTLTGAATLPIGRVVVEGFYL